MEISAIHGAWVQSYAPTGSMGVAALVAAIPILLFFCALTFLRLKGIWAGLITVASALAVAVLFYRMPAGMALASAAFGFGYGLWPIAWIIVSAVFLYQVTVRTGQFEIIRASVVSITRDQRLQLLLVGFSFGSFLEGAAGFGAPVAITASLLVGLGFDPLYAAGLCLIANTAPVAFGAMGIPIVVSGQVTGLDPFHIGAIAGHQLPLLSVVVPFWLVLMMDGVKGVRETWPAVLVTGLSFAVTQYLTANYVGPELPDITSALVSMLALTLFLRVWQPKRIFTFAGAGRHAAADDRAGTVRYSRGQVARAWSPFLVLTLMVLLWSSKPFKALFGKGGELAGWVSKFHVPYLDGLVIKMPPIVTEAKPYEAIFKIDWLSSVGSAIFLSALIAMLVLRMRPADGARALRETLSGLRLPIASIGLVLAFAFVSNYSGMSATLGLFLAQSGSAFPFVSPFLGWLGVFLTGSDTSSNALFSALQATTAHQIGVSDLLLVAANSTGGVTGKMISPQSIAVACAAVGLVGRESDLFRFTVRHSLLFCTVAGIMTYVMAYLL